MSLLDFTVKREKDFANRIKTFVSKADCSGNPFGYQRLHFLQQIKQKPSKIQPIDCNEKQDEICHWQ